MTPLDFLHRQKWIEIATADLTAPAQERIQLEIEAHFLEAVENHSANGCNEIDAHMAAWQELGDPAAAAKRFRKNHLTAKEAAHIQKLLKEFGNRPSLLTSFAIMPAQFLICEFFKVSYPLPLFVGFALVYPSIQLAIFLLAQTKNKPNLQTLLLLMLFGEAIFTSALISPYMFFPSPWFLLICICFGVFLIMLQQCYKSFLDFKILLKVYKAKELWQEMPPDNMAAS